MINNEKLERLARLAKLSLLAEDADALLTDITDIVKVAQTLDDVDLSLMDCSGDNEVAEMREDTVKASLQAEAVLSNAAIKRDGYFVAPSIGEKAE